jgi:DNA-binding transcriptional ArsR family regulator
VHQRRPGPRAPGAAGAGPGVGRGRGGVGAAVAHDRRAPARMRGQDALIHDQIDRGPGRDRRELSMNSNRVEQQMGRAIAPRHLEFDEDASVGPEAHAVLGQPGAEEIATELLLPEALDRDGPVGPRSPIRAALFVAFGPGRAPRRSPPDPGRPARQRLALRPACGAGPCGAGRVTRRAVTKYLQVLAAAGVVRDSRVGRERYWELDPRPLEAARRSLESISHHGTRRSRAWRSRRRGHHALSLQSKMSAVPVAGFSTRSSHRARSGSCAMRD